MRQIERTPWLATAAEYTAALIALAGRGRAWRPAPGTRTHKWWTGLAAELVRLHVWLVGLNDELDPRATTEALGAWERSLGIPTPGQTLAATVEERRLVVTAQLLAGTTITEADWIALAEAAGWPGATISHGYTEAATCESPSDYLVGGDRWAAFAWYLDLPDPDSEGPDVRFEALCQRLKPANTLLIIRYT